MTIIEYNLRVIILSIIASIGSVVIAFELIKEGKELGWFKNNFNKYKIVCYIVGGICSLLMLLYMTISIAQESDTSTTNVTVTDVMCESGVGGYTAFESYTLYFETDDGEKLTVDVSVFSSNKFKKQISLINKGDKLKIKYTKYKFNIFYDFEKIY